MNQFYINELLRAKLWPLIHTMGKTEFGWLAVSGRRKALSSVMRCQSSRVGLLALTSRDQTLTLEILTTSSLSLLYVWVFVGIGAQFPLHFSSVMPLQYTKLNQSTGVTLVWMGARPLPAHFRHDWELSDYKPSSYSWQEISVFKLQAWH